MIKTDPSIRDLRDRVLDVFDDLRRGRRALDPREARSGLHATTHLTFVHVGERSTAFVAFGPVSTSVTATDMIRACSHRGVACEWEGAGHLVIVSLGAQA